MNPQLEKLHAIAAKNERRILGLMSGTSLDGVDLAFCTFCGSGKETRVSVDAFETIPIPAELKDSIQKLITGELDRLPELTTLHAKLGRFFAEAVNSFLAKRKISKKEVDLIASHGQTVCHLPAHQEGDSNATLQIGDADHIALLTGIITISDFRQKHIAAGGQGAPLVPYGDLLIFAETDHDVFLINIGGISNFSYIPAGGDASGLICSDAGPGNTLMDIWVKKHFEGMDFDRDGQIASRGKVQEELLKALMGHPFFKTNLPRTTGRELFNEGYIENAIGKSGMKQISPENMLATLNLFTASCIIDSLRLFNRNSKHSSKIYISGGGSKNLTLMNHLHRELLTEASSFHETAEKGIPSDAKEAVLFALLANECVAGDASIFKGNEKFLPAVSMGKISLPE